jgi:hypothetical protein
LRVQEELFADMVHVKDVRTKFAQSVVEHGGSGRKGAVTTIQGRKSRMKSLNARGYGGFDVPVVESSNRLKVLDSLEEDS